jgi:hypothetical protein
MGIWKEWVLFVRLRVFVQVVNLFETDIPRCPNVTQAMQIYKEVTEEYSSVMQQHSGNFPSNGGDSTS